MIEKIGIFFGSDTGNTAKVARMIQKNIGENISKIFDISKTNKEDIEKFNIMIFGIPTWYYGDPQSDWDDFFPTLEQINFKNKLVAIFGCGDQEDYAEYFCDAMGILANIVKNNGAIIIGKWKKIDYFFESSKALIDETTFFGLAIDQDRQAEKTNKRIENWTKQLSKEIDNILNIN